MDGTPFGRYRLISQVGTGAMGEVWQAYDASTDRMVAVKTLAPHFAKDPAYQARFSREAQAASRLNNPHIVPVYDFGEIDGRLFVAMALVDGHELGVEIRQGPLHPLRAVSIVEQIADALDAAHRIGLVHRNVKPSNILLRGREDEWAYLIDFGVAPATTDTALTGTDKTIGTWAYMAPERFTSDDVGPPSDIYELTCVLYECLTGSRPFPADSVQQQVAGHLSAPPPQPSRLRPELPAAIDQVIAIGMAKDARQRYPSAKALAAAARSAFSAPQPTPYYPPSTNPTAPYLPAPYPYPAPRGNTGRNVAIAVGVIGAIVVVGLGLTAAVALTNKSSDRTSASRSTASADPRSDPRVIASSIDVGDCISELPTAETVYTLPRVDCAEPHRGEAFATVTADDAPTYPGVDVMLSYDGECTDEIDFDPPKGAGLYLLYPIEDTWDDGDRTIVCIVTTEEPTTGSVR